MEDKKFISELEECILANSSENLETPKYTSDELAEIYLNGDYDQMLSEELMNDDDEDDEEIVQVIYIDDSNFAKLDPEEMKVFFEGLTKILGANPYTTDEVERFITQLGKKQKD